MKRANRPRQSLRRRLMAGVLWLLQEFVYRGRTVVVASMLLGLVAIGGMLAWRHVAPLISGRDEYVVTAERITLSAPPAWLSKEIASEALEDAGLAGQLSLLDAELLPRIVEALELHPWIRSVKRVEKRYPARIAADVEYRLPVAAVETNRTSVVELCPIDKDAVRLPAVDVPANILVRLPRIADAGQPPLVGQPFEGPQIAGAVALIQYLKDDWAALSLSAVTPRERPEIRGEEKFPLYDLITSGGTRIHWGAAPEAAPPDESPAEQKLARLKAYVETHKLDLKSVQSPEMIDVRRDVTVTPRVAKLSEGQPK